jgi:SAM-dependent methyltransferase
VSVAGHLRIDLDEYDARIRTFVPGYESMLTVASGVLDALTASRPTVVDLGTGTGALAEACLAVRPGARLVGVDADPGMLEVARARLRGRGRADLREGDFLEAGLPACDAIVACLALHHVRTPAAKRSLYARCHAALRPGGVLVSADRFLGTGQAAEAAEREAWASHLRRSYTGEEAEAYLAAWGEEDVYFHLEDELTWLREPGFVPEIAWRREGFAVLAAWRDEVPPAGAAKGRP